MDVKLEIAAAEALLLSWSATVEKFALIGSALYLSDSADVDFVVKVKEGTDAIEYGVALEDKGWGKCGNYDTKDSTWIAIRRENLNLMITHSEAFYKGYVLAMEVCKGLRLERKEDRILVCRIVRDGFTAEEAQAQSNNQTWKA